MKAAHVQRYKLSGFTLIEMIMVISIMGMIGVLISLMLGSQMEGYVAMSRRAALAASANALMTHLERDIRNAVPNSIRISGNAMELVPIVTSLRYREAHSSNAGSDTLDFSGADIRFQLLGSVDSLPAGARLVVHNTGLASGTTPISGMNLYASASAGSYPPAGAHVITPASTTLTLTNDAAGDFITLSAGHQFSFASPQKRMYVVINARSYRFDSAAQRLFRYHNYSIQGDQPASTAQFSALGASSTLMASGLTACSFTYQPGTPQQSALVTIRLRLEDAEEKIELLHQVHVDNAI